MLPKNKARNYWWKFTLGMPTLVIICGAHSSALIRPTEGWLAQRRGFVMLLVDPGAVVRALPLVRRG